MTTLRVRVPHPPAGDGRLVVRGAEHRYLSRVRRAVAGEAVEVLDGVGGRWRGAIERIESAATTLAGLQPAALPAPVPLILALGLGRPEPLVRVVRAAAELAVSAVVPLRCARGLARDAHALDALVERWGRVAAEALRTGGVPRAPGIVSPVTPAAWAASLAPGTARLLLDAAGAPLVEVVAGLRAPGAPAAWALAVGPEGGFTSEEGAQLVAAGFAAVSLCPIPLRVETAAVGALGALRALAG